MEVANVLASKPTSKIYGLLGNINITTNLTNYSIVTEERFNGTVKEYLNSPKDISALKVVMLNENYISKKLEDLSESERKIISLAKALINNKEYIILDYFEKGLNDKEKENFKRLFKKISQDYQKTILIFTNDITFLWDIVEEYLVVDEKGIVNTIPKENIFDIIDLLDKPEIVKFTNLLKTKNIKIENYKNVQDLLKAIYRIRGE